MPRRQLQPNDVWTVSIIREHTNSENALILLRDGRASYRSASKDGPSVRNAGEAVSIEEMLRTIVGKLDAVASKLNGWNT